MLIDNVKPPRTSRKPALLAGLIVVKLAVALGAAKAVRAVVDKLHACAKECTTSTIVATAGVVLLVSLQSARSVASSSTLMVPSMAVTVREIWQSAVESVNMSTPRLCRRVLVNTSVEKSMATNCCRLREKKLKSGSHQIPKSIFGKFKNEAFPTRPGTSPVSDAGHI